MHVPEKRPARRRHCRRHAGKQKRRGSRDGAYPGMRKVVRKLMACSKVPEARWFVGDSSPELMLRRSSPVVHGPVALAHMETNKRFSEVCKMQRTRKEGRAELGVDGHHRKRSFLPVEMADSGGKMRAASGRRARVWEGNRRRGTWGLYGAKEGRESSRLWPESSRRRDLRRAVISGQRKKAR